jgi:hypothetical protein
LREVQPSDRVQRVEVRPHNIAEIRRRECQDVREGVHRSAPEGLPGFDVDSLTPRRVHHNERIKVGLGFDSDLVGLLLIDLIHECYFLAYDLLCF